MFCIIMYNPHFRVVGIVGPLETYKDCDYAITHYDRSSCKPVEFDGYIDPIVDFKGTPCLAVQTRMEEVPVGSRS